MNPASLVLLTKPDTRVKISRAEDVFNNVVFPTTEQECFIVLLLNTKNVVIEQHLVSIGTIDSALVHPREVFKEAIRKNATNIIIVHNHPSGNPEPSDEDHQITVQMTKAGKLLGIPVLDHVVIGDGWYYSFNDKVISEIST